MLFLVSTPIGNYADISLRALDVLRTADVLYCEDLKEGRRLLHYLKIDREAAPFNEHTRQEATAEAFEHLLEGRSVALFSDAGTPLIADPGNELVRKCIEFGLPVTTVPGASSILPALQLSGFPTERFTFAGFLPREKDRRVIYAKQYRGRKETLVFLEAPYRLRQVLQDLGEALGKDRKAAVCQGLTEEKERVERGTLSQLAEHYSRSPFKGEFVIVVMGDR